MCHANVGDLGARELSRLLLRCALVISSIHISNRHSTSQEQSETVAMVQVDLNYILQQGRVMQRM